MATVTSVKVPKSLLKGLQKANFPKDRLGLRNGRLSALVPLERLHRNLTPEVLNQLNTSLRWGLLVTPHPEACCGVFPSTTPMLITDPDTFTSAPEGLTLAHYLSMAPGFELHLRSMAEITPKNMAANADLVNMLTAMGKEVDFHAPFLRIFDQYPAVFASAPKGRMFELAFRYLFAPQETLGQKLNPDAKFGLGEATIDEYQRMIDLCETTGMELFSFHCTGAGKPYLTDADFNAFSSRVRQVVDYARPKGVAIAVETGGLSEKQHFELYQATGAGTLLDGVHYGIGTGGIQRDPVAFFKKALAEGLPIPLIHLGNSIQEIAGGDSHSPLHLTQADLPAGQTLNDFGLASLIREIAKLPLNRQPLVRLEIAPNSLDSIAFLAKTLGIIK